MNKDQIIEAALAKPSELLATEYRAGGLDFADRAKSAASMLPNELAQAVADLAALRVRLASQADAESGPVADFAVRCGQVYEQLRAYRQIEMELENVRIGPESVETGQLQAAQVEPLARFIEARDRVFRQVADFTLKALLVMLGLLTLGLVLGLV